MCTNRNSKSNIYCKYFVNILFVQLLLGGRRSGRGGEGREGKGGEERGGDKVDLFD